MMSPKKPARFSVGFADFKIFERHNFLKVDAVWKIPNRYSNFA